MKVKQLIAGGAAFLFLLPASLAGAELPITSDYGWRIHPVSGDWRFHTGIDLGYAYGTPVPAMFDGFVVMSGNFGDGYGNQVMLYHPAFDAYTRYAHMATISVDLGDSVVQGETLGSVGDTGNATGPHLHLEYITRDASGQYVYIDPIILWH